MWLGQVLLWLTMAAALAAAFAYFRAELQIRIGGSPDQKETGVGSRVPTLQIARRLFWLMGALIAATMAYLWWLILTQRYEVVYVHDYTNRDLPTLYRFSALWAGQAGTWVLWAFFTMLWGLLLRSFAKPYETATLAILSGLNFLLLLPVAIEDPFRLLMPTPDDGQGMNPLLQNPWMAIHPPAMFFGYASMALPFALALAGLWRKDWHGWVRYALPAAGLGVASFGLGIVLGGIWSYEVLGWGGYWAWDPVENASFIPWLASIGLVHLLIVQSINRSSARLTTFFGLATFLTTYYATFVTRSGFIQSVHAFGTTTTTWWVLGIMIFLTATSLGLFVARTRQLPPERKPAFDSLTSMNFFAYASMVILAVFAIVVFVGLSYPWVIVIGNALGLTQVEEVGVHRTFYDKASFPIAIAMCLTLAFASFLAMVRPKDKERWAIWKAVVPWLIGNATLATALLAFIFGIRQPVSLLLFASASVCIIASLYALYLRARRSLLTIGGPIAHLGVGIFLLGVIGSELHDQSQNLVISAGEHRAAFGYLFTFTKLQEREDGKYEVLLQVQRLGKETSDSKERFAAKPVMFVDERFGLVREPFIRRYLTHDIYIEPVNYEPKHEGGIVELGRGQKTKVGKWNIEFVKFEMSGQHRAGMGSKVTAVVKLTEGNKVHTLKPYWLLKAEGIEEKPDRVQGTKIVVNIERINADEGMVTLSISGIEGLHRHGESIVINVQHKPFVSLVWLGSALVLLGAFLAGIRRTKEAMKMQSATLTTQRKGRR